ncbi:hypothetical protein WJX82_010771 [Trebouxia sp. C0006]
MQVLAQTVVKVDGIHRAVVGRFRHPNTSDVLLAKETFLVLASANDEGSLTTHHTQPLHATILNLQVLRAQQQATSSQVYAACGDSSSGSIRVIQADQTVEVLYESPADYPGISGMWSIPPWPGADFHSLLVLSFASGSRAMATGGRGCKLVAAGTYKPGRFVASNEMDSVMTYDFKADSGFRMIHADRHSRPISHCAAVQNPTPSQATIAAVDQKGRALFMAPEPETYGPERNI